MTEGVSGGMASCSGGFPSTLSKDHRRQLSDVICRLGGWLCMDEEAQTPREEADGGGDVVKGDTRDGDGSKGPQLPTSRPRPTDPSR